MLSIRATQALLLPREWMQSHATRLYLAARIDDLVDPALRLRIHALAARHLHADGAQEKARAALKSTAIHAALRETGLECALLTAAMALGAGIDEASIELERAWTCLEQLAWHERREMYAASVSNAGVCAALLTAFETGGSLHYLRRAEMLCRTVTARMRPEPHAHCEWALPLLRLARHPVALAHSGSWLVPTAARLFDAVTPDLLETTDFGRLSRGLAVATMLALHTGATRRLQRHERIWNRCRHACLALGDHGPEAAAAMLHAIDRMPHHL